MLSNTHAGARASVITPAARFELAVCVCVHVHLSSIFAVVALYYLRVCARIRHQLLCVESSVSSDVRRIPRNTFSQPFCQPHLARRQGKKNAFLICFIAPVQNRTINKHGGRIAFWFLGMGTKHPGGRFDLNQGRMAHGCAVPWNAP
jgi:hypothetical protein